MVSGATLSKGYTLKNASSYPIAEIFNLGDFGGSRADVKVTSTDSEGNWEEYIAGMIEGGEFAAGCYFKATDSSGQVQAITDCLAGTRQIYTITMNDGTTFSALMHVKSFKFGNNPLTEAIKLNLVFKIDGEPTITPAT